VCVKLCAAKAVCVKLCVKEAVRHWWRALLAVQDTGSHFFLLPPLSINLGVRSLASTQGMQIREWGVCAGNSYNLGGSCVIAATFWW